MADGLLENDANDDDDESGMDDVMVQLKEAVCPVFTLVVVTLEIPRIKKKNDGNNSGMHNISKETPYIYISLLSNAY